MGDKILIYDTGNRYEIDSDLIYVPKFVQPLLKKRIDAILPDGLEFIFNEDKNEETVPISDTGQG